jgi:hypothetical protein
MSPSIPTENQATSRIFELESWTDFEDKIRWLDTLIVREGPIDERFKEPLFRGQGHHHSEWRLETTLERFAAHEKGAASRSLLAYYRKISAAKPVLESLSGKSWQEFPDFATFTDRLQNNPWGWLDSVLNSAGVYEYLVYLRHHGFPSPLLDWTASPFVAAFFAFDEMSAEAQHVCVYALLEREMRVYSWDAHFFVVGPYIRTDVRHYLQQSRYSLFVAGEKNDFLFRPHEELLLNENGFYGELFEFRIPASERSVALRKLESMNINPYSLFGSEDALVRTVARRECYFKSW